VIAKSVTPRISKACLSLRVPDQCHSVQVVSPSWTDRQISAQKSGIPASMACQLASIWARPAKARPGCAGVVGDLQAAGKPPGRGVQLLTNKFFN